MSSDLEIAGTFGAIWSDLGMEDSFPHKRPLLAHYTSIATLEAIMSNDELWFSNPLFMNDLDELRFGINEGARTIRQSQAIKEACGSEERHEKFLEIFEAMLATFSAQHAFDIYILYLSEHDVDRDDGLLSMWRGYGGNGNGAAIIFDSQKLNENDESPFIVSKVVYLSTKERVEWLENKCSEFSAILKDVEVANDQLHIPIWGLFERVKTFAIFTKHSGFAEEREWRAVYMRERDKNGKLDEMLGYAIGRNGVEPKLKFKIRPVEGMTTDDFSLPKIVRKIILGPSMSSPLAVSAVQRMLEKLDKQELAKTLIGSTTPFRG